jgi:hypothetical protein
MSESKHSPAPWRNDGAQTIVDANNANVALALQPRAMSDETYEFNRNLIAAAPELLEALIKVSELAKQLSHDCCELGLKKIALEDETIRRAWEVISKAKGETK